MEIGFLLKLALILVSGDEGSFKNRSGLEKAERIRMTIQNAKNNLY